MGITHARTVTLPVADLDRARDFYVDVLGFSVVADRTVGPVRHLEVAPSGAQTRIALSVAEQGCGHGIVLESDDVDADCARLAAAGVRVEEPEDHPWGREAAFADPDGNAFVLAGQVPEGY